MIGASMKGGTWAVVLAAGSGTRLSSLTRDSEGAAVPKQFSSLHGGAHAAGASGGRSIRR